MSISVVESVCEPLGVFQFVALDRAREMYSVYFRLSPYSSNSSTQTQIHTVGGRGCLSTGMTHSRWFTTHFHVNNSQIDFVFGRTMAGRDRRKRNCEGMERERGREGVKGSPNWFHAYRPSHTLTPAHTEEYIYFHPLCRLIYHVAIALLALEGASLVQQWYQSFLLQYLPFAPFFYYNCCLYGTSSFILTVGAFPYGQVPLSLLCKRLEYLL